MQILALGIYVILWIGIHASDYDDDKLPTFKGHEAETDCPSINDRWVTTIQIPWGTPGRATLTLPPEIALRPSSIPGAGTGTFATTFIPKHTWLSEYEGEVLQDEEFISDFAWSIHRDGAQEHLIDAYDERTSTWIRWVNCARHVKEQNVDMKECYGKIYYMTIKDIHPGEELFVYYGDEYATDQLAIDTNLYRNMDFDLDLYRKYPCWKF